ncbi:hypothetical protein [Lentimonas sp. CC4]|uniref:hypothetical protein n=1 Tax=Lentimonas sp. CC4 TaxID=2676099 RepID=UPI001A7E5E03|nr:hypothetical protein [Lentimonas sp. CC4]
MKGCFFITTTTALIWVLVRRHSRKLEAATREREQLYYKTVESAHHILLNYLNKMQFVTLEAERFEDFDRNILQVSVDATDDAAEALHRLSHLPKPSTMRVHKVAYKGVVHPSDRDLEM